MNRRTFIKHKVLEMLQAANLDFKNIELNRPNPLLLDNLPRVIIYSGDENVKLISGTEFVPKQYERHFVLNIDVITYAQEESDDQLDKVSAQIEFALFEDIFLGNQNDILGMQLQSTRPYQFDDGADKIYWATTLTFVYAYDTDTYPDKKPDNFDEYSMDIDSVDGTPVDDPPAIAAEGNL